jgi:hypothetical protein
LTILLRPAVKVYERDLDLNPECPEKQDPDSEKNTALMEIVAEF